MARDFSEGSTQYLYAASAPATAVPVTMACWFNPDTVSNQDVLICLVQDSSPWAQFSLRARGDLAYDYINAMAYNGATAGAAKSTSGFSASTWQHACGVFVSSTSRYAYLNGGNKGSNTTNVTPSGIDSVFLGAIRTGAPDGNLEGSLADVGIWTAALTDDEVLMLAKGLSPLMVRPGSLVFYARLIRTEDWDMVGGISLTAVNSPGVVAHPFLLFPSRQVVPVAGLVPPIYVTPAPAEAQASALNPGVVLGSISLTPATAQALAATLPPGVVLGSIVLTPAVAEALASTLDPGVVLGSIDITPAIAQALGQALDPLVVLSSVSVTPGVSGSEAASLDPGVELGSIILTPAIAEALASAQDPVVTLGSIILTPAIAEALASLQDPIVTMSSMSVTPEMLEALASCLDPNVVISGEEVVKELRIINLLWTFGAGLRR